MHRPQRRHGPNDLVKPLPPATQTFDCAFRRRRRQGDQEEKRRHPDGDVQMLRDILDDITEVEEHVEPDVHRQVETGVPKRDQTERSAVLRDAVPARVTAKRGDGEGESQESQRPESGLDLELFNRIGAQIVRQRAAREPGDGQKADENERDRREAAVVRPRSLAWDGGRRQ